MHDNTTKNISKYTYEHITIWFGCSTHLVSDQGNHCINEVIKVLMKKIMIIITSQILVTFKAKDKPNHQIRPLSNY